MLRPISRLALRKSLPRSTSFNASPRLSRLLSTAPPAKKTRSWKSSALRWGVAAGGVYYYTTSDVFAESPKCRSRKQFVGDADLNVLIEIVSQKSLADNAEEPEPPTIESISPKHRNVSRPSIAGQDGESASTEHKSILKESEEGEGLSDDVQELEDEAGSEGAFNPETGEINWDCPCLGGMAHGPCGEEFKAAFSCFVYSKDEPKGIDCIDKFKGMQDCFRQYPEIYGEELDEEEEEEGKKRDGSGEIHGIEDADPSPNSTSSPTPSDSLSQVGTPEKIADTRSLPSTPDPEQEVADKQIRTKAAGQAMKPVRPESEGPPIPKASHDAKQNGNGK